jgi:hypothetical protein
VRQSSQEQARQHGGNRAQGEQRPDRARGDAALGTQGRQVDQRDVDGREDDAADDQCTGQARAAKQGADGAGLRGGVGSAVPRRTTEQGHDQQHAGQAERADEDRASRRNRPRTPEHEDQARAQRLSQRRSEGVVAEGGVVPAGRRAVRDEGLLADNGAQVPDAHQHAAGHQAGHPTPEQDERSGGEADQQAAGEHDPALAEAVDRMAGRHREDQRGDREAGRHHAQPARRHTQLQRTVGRRRPQHEGHGLDEDAVREQDDQRETAHSDLSGPCSAWTRIAQRAESPPWLRGS